MVGGIVQVGIRRVAERARVARERDEKVVLATFREAVSLERYAAVRTQKGARHREARIDDHCERIVREVVVAKVDLERLGNARCSESLRRDPDGESDRLPNVVANVVVDDHCGHRRGIGVDPRVSEAADGIHFARISDAVAAARSTRIARGELREAACRTTIVVAPGVYRGSLDGSPDGTLEQFPLIIDVPQITLRGGLQMVTDAEAKTGAAIGLLVEDVERTIRFIASSGRTRSDRSVGCHPTSSHAMTLSRDAELRQHQSMDAARGR